MIHANTPVQRAIRELYWQGLGARDISRRLYLPGAAFVYSELRAMRQGVTRPDVCGCMGDYLSRPLEESHICPHQPRLPQQVAA